MSGPRVRTCARACVRAPAAIEREREGEGVCVCEREREREREESEREIGYRLLLRAASPQQRPMGGSFEHEPVM
jgi:hypothetical protein